MDLSFVVLFQSLLVAGLAAFAVYRANGGKQVKELQRHVDSLLDRLGAVDWAAYHRSRMEVERQRTQNVALAYSSPGLPSPEEMETHGF